MFKNPGGGVAGWLDICAANPAPPPRGGDWGQMGQYEQVCGICARTPQGSIRKPLAWVPRFRLRRARRRRRGSRDAAAAPTLASGSRGRRRRGWRGRRAGRQGRREGPARRRRRRRTRSWRCLLGALLARGGSVVSKRLNCVLYCMHIIFCVYEFFWIFLNIYFHRSTFVSLIFVFFS